MDRQCHHPAFKRTLYERHSISLLGGRGSIQIVPGLSES